MPGDATGADLLALTGEDPPQTQPATPPDATPPAPQPVHRDATGEDLLHLDEDRDRLTAAASTGMATDPARAAKLIALQARTGLPTALIDRNLDTVTAAVRQRDFDPDAFRRQSPMVAQWLSEDPARAGLTRDDLPALAATEALVRASPQYAYQADGSIVESFPGSGYGAVYQNAAELRAALTRRGLDQAFAQQQQDRAEARLKAFGVASPLVAGGLMEGGRMLAAAHRLGGSDTTDIQSGLEETGAASEAVDPGAWGTIGRFLGGQVVDAPLYLAGGALAKLSQNVLKAATVGRTLSPLLEKVVTGAATMQPLAVRDALADPNGWQHALASWAIDSGVAGAFGPVGVGRFAAKAAGAEVSALSATASGLGLWMQHLGLGASQNAAFDLAHRLHDYASGVDPEALEWHNLLPSLATSGALGAIPSALFGIPEAVARAREIHDRAGMVQVNRMSAALSTADRLGQIADAVNDTQAAKLNQDATGDLLKRLAGNTDIRTLYVDAKAWREHFDTLPVAEGAQEAPGARTLAQRALGDPLAYDKALSAGGQIAVPLDRFVPLLADPASREFLLAEARTAPEAMNKREAQEAVASATAIAAARAEAAGPGSREADLAASADLVHEDVKRQQIAAGVEESTAERNAQLWRSVMHTAAARGWVPDSPMDAYQRFNLRVQRGMAQPMVRSTIDALIERLKAGDIPTEQDVERSKSPAQKPETPTLDAIKELGGIAKGAKAGSGEQDGRPAGVRGIAGKHAPDVMAKMLAERGIGDGSTNALWKLVGQEHEAKTRADQGRQPTEDSERVHQIRTSLLSLLEHFRSIGADVSKESTDQLKQRLLAVAQDKGEALEQPAYHGSPHQFDKFTTDHMGTGEGQQAFGWGLYFAGKKEVAEFYRNKLSPTKFTFDGKSLTLEKVHAAVQRGEMPQEMLSIASAVRNAKTLDGAQEFLDHAAEGNTTWTPIAEFLRANRDRFRIESKGKVYTVDIPGDEKFLLWDKPFRDASPEVRGAVERILKDHPEAQRLLDVSAPGAFQAKDVDHFHGEGIYRVLAQVLGSDEAASRALAANGVEGIRYLDGSSRSDADGSHNYVLFNGDAARITHYEQRTGADGPRGTFLPSRLSASGESIITLLKGADRSTFLHETGHALLEFMHDLAARDDAPQAVKDDLAKIRDWLGAEGDAPITREQHELFARGFERYLMEGKAPSPGLRGAFQRFKQWLKDIYRQATGLHVHLSDDVRQVFDRMLASDDEIAAARQESGADDPLFKDQAESGMNDQQWAAYHARLQEGKDRAREILEREVMAPLRAEATHAYQEARTKTRLQVADEVNQQPVYTALLVLQKGAWPEGIEIPEGMERVKLDKADLVGHLAGGEAGLSLMPGPGEGRPNRGRALWTTKDGISCDEAAELFGFRDGGDLVHALLNAPDRHAEIDRQTDERMRDVHPDPLLDGSLPEKARVAVDNDARLEAMEREAAALALTAKRTATPSELLHAVARAQIDKTPVAELRPSLYRVARDRAVRAAAEAQGRARATADPAEKAKATGEALDHKTNEILQTHLYREATAAKACAERNRAYAQSWDDQAKRQRIGKAGGWEWTVVDPKGSQGQERPAFSADQFDGDPAKAQQAAIDAARRSPGSDVVRTGYLEQADAIREGFDLAPASAAALGRREDLRDFIARKMAADEPVNIPQEVMDSLGKRNWREMTVAQQQAVVDALKNLEHLAKVKNQLLASDKAETFAAARDAQVAQMKATGRTRPDVGPGGADALLKMAGDYFSGMANVARFAREMDGLKDGGVMFEHWLRSMNEAEARELGMRERSTAEFGRLMKDWGKLGTVTGGVPLTMRRFEPAIGRSMSHWERIMVALNWGNADNRARLLAGHGWQEHQVDAILGKLDHADLRFVQGVLDHIDSWWSEIKAKQERVFGVAPEKVEATPIVHHSGIYRGGYFPISYDPATISRDTNLEQQANLTKQGARLYASTARGHTEARSGAPEGAKLLLDPGVIVRHLNNVVHDLAYHETLIDLNRFLRDGEIGRTMRAYWGADVFRQFQTRLRDVAAGTQTTHTGIESLLTWTRQGVNFANRAFNIGSSLQQIAGMPGALVRVGPKYFAKALVGMFRNPYESGNAFHWVDEQSAMMRNRSKTFDKNVADVMGGVSLRSPARKILDGAGYYFWTKAFQVLDTHTWLASYMKAMDEHGGDEGKARAIADQTVTDVQGSGATKDLPAAMRGGPLAQVFTSNMSWWLANYNLTAEAVNRGVRGAREGDFRSVLKAGSDLFVLYGVQVAAWNALGAVLTGKHASAWSNAVDDPGTLAKTLATDAAYTGLSSMVLVRDLADVIAEGRGYEGPAGLRSMSLIAQAVQAIEKNRGDEREVKSIAKAAGPVFHLPIAQIVDTAEGLAKAQDQGRLPLWAALFGPARQ